MRRSRIFTLRVSGACVILKQAPRVQVILRCVCVCVCLCSGVAQIRQVQTGVVTHLCADYGLIDHAVYFTSKVVLGGVVLCVGDSVQALAVREGAHGQWRALRVR